jgi:hypothetical protein
MSTFRQCRRAHTVRETLEFPGSNHFSNTLEFGAASNAGTVELSPKLPSLSTFHQSQQGVIHMNTKMILAAVALSLSLAACAKKEEPAEAAQDAAATASDAAGQAQDAAADATQAAGDAANAASDAAAPPAGETTPPAADQPATEPKQQ